MSNDITIIRAGLGTLSFLIKKEDGTNAFHPYKVKGEMSLAANLRTAFKEQSYLKNETEGQTNDNEGRCAKLMVASPVVLIPATDYNNTPDFNAEAMYSGVISGRKGEEKITCEVPELDAVAIFSVNSDLLMVVRDNFANVEVQNVIQPVWRHLYSRYYQSGQRRKLFAYFHDKTVDVCQFEQHRVRFANSFDATHAHDALYYILFVWKQLGMNQQEDDLFVIGDMPHEEWLRGRLGAYLSRVHDINPNADLNRSPLAQIEGMPFDLML